MFGMDFKAGTRLQIDLPNSYIYYGVGGKEKGDIALRKYATETNKKDEFDVKLNVPEETRLPDLVLM